MPAGKGFYAPHQRQAGTLLIRLEMKFYEDTGASFALPGIAGTRHEGAVA